MSKISKFQNKRVSYYVFSLNIFKTFIIILTLHTNAGFSKRGKIKRARENLT
jgi:hypothetical protein